MPMIEVSVRNADLANADDAAAVLELLNGYAMDEMGQGKPFAQEIRDRLIAELRRQSNAVVLLAFSDGAPAGLAISFVGFSTFKARPLLNIHDFCVSPNFQGKGVGKALMSAIEREARQRECCKVTLEVREDNLRAQKLYLACGFDAGKKGGDAMLFWGKTL
jgi:ribosomal protein S18 acetylase RimI-like enzyme